MSSSSSPTSANATCWAQSSSETSGRSVASVFGRAGACTLDAVITVDPSTPKPASRNAARSSADPVVPSTPNARCPAPGSSASNAASHASSSPAPGAEASSRKLPQ